ncbi:hypothetical protein [Nakamurella endophytica]|nr:hypothetical protein [Nakamurella endophytica]
MADSGEQGLGAIAKKWLRAKRVEWTTGVQRTREYAEHESWLAEREMERELGHQAGRALVPAYRDWEDRRDADEVRRRQAEQEAVRALPRATVRLSVSGKRYDGSWWGYLPVRLDREPDLLTVEVVVPADDRPLVGGHPLLGATLLVPGYTGDGGYDVDAAARHADAAGEPFDPFSWTVTLEAEDVLLAWVPDVGPARIDLSGDVLRWTARMTGESGEHDVDLQLSNLPPVPAA